MLASIVQDAFFAAVAAVGFSAISRPPRRAYLLCALLAAVGHSFRYVLMSGQSGGLHIVVATTLASFAVGTLAVALSPLAKVPAEGCLYPALLPMIPGIYAYKTFGSLAECIFGQSPEHFQHYFYLFAFNGITTVFILLGMVLGATLPIFVFKNVTFRATR